MSSIIGMGRFIMVGASKGIKIIRTDMELVKTIVFIECGGVGEHPKENPNR